MTRHHFEMTDRELRIAVHALGMNIQKRDGEYRINWPGADEDQAYYTDDRQDALDTARAMARSGDRSRPHFELPKNRR